MICKWKSATKNVFIMESLCRLLLASGVLFSGLLKFMHWMSAYWHMFMSTPSATFRWCQLKWLTPTELEIIWMWACWLQNISVAIVPWFYSFWPVCWLSLPQACDSCSKGFLPFSHIHSSAVHQMSSESHLLSQSPNFPHLPAHLFLTP